MASPAILHSPSTSFSLTTSFFSQRLALYPQQQSIPKSSKNIAIRAARTESKGVSLGFRPPQFQLTEPLTGRVWELEDFESHPALLIEFIDEVAIRLFSSCKFDEVFTVISVRKKTLNADVAMPMPCKVMFICNHCPFVIHLKKAIVKLSKFYMQKGLAVVAISSNSVITHPQDGPDLMAEDAKQFSYPFPYLYDESQDVAREFGAVCTPEFFLFKKDGRRPFQLVYHGQFDDSRPSNNVPVTGRDLAVAVDCVLSAQPVPSVQKPSVGCSIKWHPVTEL